ncbi:uncharacterized protein BJ171DRAFT_584291 [Polychytrium aggregatum]|uniref:uncharacterized protein n=1 Tax=Polychytrium aggregatum TaxID=110093 RepID=UPI0022FE07AB|nr:uncharacterized protein BJ171DRAFT_584291 [Polychytrium aggregatum]KAI9202390.1 hypothetical protein BJ171DRAFT_584291 [Polychytrium aggregatum]
MSKASAERTLRIGDEIVLDSPKFGQLFGEGPIQERCFVRPNFEPRSASSGDLLKSVFRVEPHWASSNMKNFRSAVEQHVDPELLNIDTLDISLPEVDHDSLENLRALAKAETHMNLSDYERLRSKPVTYGTIVQLRNLHTNKLLKANSTETCLNDSTGMRVELTRCPQRGCGFRIMPKLRLRNEGDPVRLNDTVIFQSVKSEIYLHVAQHRPDPSIGSVPDHLFSQLVHEACLSSNPHGWTLSVFNSSQPSSAAGDRSGSRAIKFGNTIQLYHRETEGYLVTSSATAVRRTDAAVSLMGFKYDPLNPQDSSSSLTFWQIEAQDSYTGGSVGWGRSVRIRNCVLNRYLRISEIASSKSKHTYRHTVDFTTDVHVSPTGDDTLFKIFQVNADERQLAVGSHVRIQHVRTGTWLHIVRNPDVPESEQYEASINGRLSSRGCPRYVLAVTSDISLEDYFLLSVVDPSLIQKFNFSQSAVSTLALFTTNLAIRPRRDDKQPRFRASEAAFTQIIAVLTALIFSCTNSNDVNPLSRQGQPQLVQQTLLRETGIIDIVLHLLKVPFTGKARLEARQLLKPLIVDSLCIIETEFADIDQARDELDNNLDIDDVREGHEYQLSMVMQYSCRLLQQFLLGSDHENQSYVSREFHTLAGHVDLKIGAAETLMQLISGNHLIVQSISNNEIEGFLELLRRDKEPSYIAFLIALCQCDGYAIPKHQNYIAEELVRKSLEIEDGSIIPIRISSSNELEARDNAAYFEALMQLYEALCFGHNRLCAELLSSGLGLITEDICVAGMLDEGLPLSIRSRYCSLLRVIFLDRFPVSPMQSDYVFPLETIENPPTLKYVLDDADLGEDEPLISDESLCRVTEWAEVYLPRNTVQYFENKHENEFLLSVLKLIKFLVKYGFYKEPELILTFVSTLISILDGNLDSRNPKHYEELQSKDKASDAWWSKSRFQNNDQSAIVIQCKIEIIQIIEIIMGLRIEMRVYCNPEATKGSSLHTLGFASAKDLFSSVYHETEYFKLAIRLTPILLDLLRYDRPALRKVAIRLLHRLHSSTEELIAILKRSLLLNNEEYINTYDWIKEKMGIFINAETSTSNDRRLMGDLDEEIAPEIAQTLRDFAQLAIYGAKTTGSSDDDTVVPAPVASVYLEFAPDRINQWSMKNLNLFDIVIRLLQKRVDHASRRRGQAHNSGLETPSLSTSQSQAAGLSSILQLSNANDADNDNDNENDNDNSRSIEDAVLVACFEFLRNYANQHKEHQDAVFSNLDLLLEATHPLRCCCSLAAISTCIRYLGELFSQSFSACLRITERQYRRILELSGGKRAAYMELLRRTVKSEKKIIKRNQSIVMRLLLEQGELYVPVGEVVRFFQSGADFIRSRRGMEIPLSDRSISVDYVVELIDTLAICCEDKNQIMQTMANSLLSTENVLMMLSSPISPLALKRVLLRLLASVHTWDIVRQSSFQNNDKIQLHPLIWRLIKESMHHLETISFQGDSVLDEEAVKYYFDGVLVFLQQLFSKMPSTDSFDEEAQAISNQYVDLLSQWLQRQADNPRVSSAIQRRVERCISTMLGSGFRGHLRHSEQHTVSTTKRLSKTQTFAENVDSPLLTWDLVHERTLGGDVAGMNQAFQKCINLLEEDEDVIQIMESERSNLAKLFHLDGQIDQKTKSLRITTVKSLIQHLVQMSDVYNDSADGSRSLAQSSEASDKLETCNRADDPEKWSHLEKRKVSYQNELNRIGCTLMAERLLTSTDEGILAAALQLMIAILDGGNAEAQRTLQTYWQGTREERFFYCIHNRIQGSINLLKETKDLMQYVNRKESRHASTVDLGGYPQNLSLQDSMSSLAQIQSDVFAGTSKDSDGHRDWAITRSVMRLLQLLVEGHNLPLQDYVRIQPDNIKTFDLVKDTVEYLHAVVPVASKVNVDVIVQVLNTIIDLAQGCTANQVNIFNAKIIQPINIILAETFETLPRKTVSDMKAKATLSLLSLLEDDQDPKIQYIFKEMSTTLDIKTLLRILNSIYKLGVADVIEARRKRRPNRQLIDYVRAPKDLLDFFSVDEETESAEDVAERALLMDCGFLCAMLLVTLEPHLSREKAEACNGSAPFLWFRKHTGRIEIIRDHHESGQKRLYTVLFPIPEICKYLQSEAKSRFLWEKERVSPQEKLEAFCNSSSDLIYEIRFHAKVAANRFLRRLAENRDIWWRSMYTITLALNLANLWCIIESPKDSLRTESVCSLRFEFIRLILGLLQFLLWSVSVVEYSWTQYPMDSNRHRMELQLDEMRRARALRLKSDWSDSEALNDTAPISADQTPQPSDWVETALSFLKWPRSQYHTIMLLFSFLGLFQPAFFCIHLLDFVYRDAELQEVIKSITVNGTSLSRTALLGVIVIYIYSVVAFVFFGQVFKIEESKHCDSVLFCFATILNYGIRSGGGIGELMAVPDLATESYSARVALELSFFLVVVVFLLNAIFGIIFDTFGQLREEHKAIADDLKSCCFICSIEAPRFQRHGKGFEHHVQHEHNIWNYLFFLVHLENKDVSEYTSHESYFSEKFAQHDLSIFPINRAISLNEDQSVAAEARLKYVEDSLDKIITEHRLSLQNRSTESREAAPKSTPFSNVARTLIVSQAISKFKRGRLRGSNSSSRSDDIAIVPDLIVPALSVPGVAVPVTNPTRASS